MTVMSMELTSDSGVLHQDACLTMDFPLEHRHKRETQVLKLTAVLRQSSTKKVTKTHFLKHLSESSQQMQLQEAEKALDEFCDENDLTDSIHIAKRRFKTERYRREETRKGLEHMVSCLDSGDDDDHLRDSVHLAKRRFDAERVCREETRKGLEHMVSCLDSGDDDDHLRDSVHLAKRRFDAERVCREVTHKGLGLEHMYDGFESDDDDDYLRDSNHLAKRKGLEQMTGVVDSNSTPMTKEQTIAKAA